MDRRAFFRRALEQSRDKIGRAVVKIADEKVQRKAKRWIRPPFALDELRFLLACTRCQACVEACPQQVVFTLPSRTGLDAAGTPALDLLNRGCHLCEDWPCVEACESGALHRDAPQTARAEDCHPGASSPPRLPPRLATVKIDPQRCLPFQGPECGVCVDACPVEGAIRLDGARPVIDAAHCIGCARCRESCITLPKAISVHHPIAVHRQ